MKKILIVVVALLVTAIIFIMPVTFLMVKQGFLHQDKTWAPGLVYSGARVRMRLQQYRTAATILTKAVDVFPSYKNTDKAYFWIALCHEKNKSPKQAVQWYQQFLQRWPDHDWSAQAQARVDKLKVQFEL